MTTKKVFVYGTLKRGYCNHKVIEKFIASVTPAVARGWLYDLGAYPAMVKGNGWVFGELVEFLPEFEDEAFRSMDRLEGVNYAKPSAGLYERVTMTAFTNDGKEITCDTYYMPSRRQGSFTLGELLPAGVWPQNSEQEPMLYVAYGSCMSESSFAETVRGYRVIGRVELPGWKVAFTRYAESRKGGVADLVMALGAVAEGILYSVPVDQMKALDRREGAPTCYRRLTIPVVCDGRLFEVVTYEVCSKSLEEFAPHPEYVQLILDGTSLLSPAYVRSLQAHMSDLQENAKRTLLSEASIAEGVI